MSVADRMGPMGASSSGGGGGPRNPRDSQPVREGTGSQATRFRVLVVDDDPSSLATLAAVLGDHAEVVECRSPEEALALLTPETRVLCTDFKMPTMNGVSLAREVTRRQPHVSCLVITGTDEDLGAQYYVLRKPFDPNRLMGIVLGLARISEQKRSLPRSDPRS